MIFPYKPSLGNFFMWKPKAFEQCPLEFQQSRRVEMRKNRRGSGRTLHEAMLKGDVRFAGHVEVRGGYYHDMWEAKVDGLLAEGAWLSMKREPDNVHDRNAISVWVTPPEMVPQRIGYVEKEKAEYLAPFMDIGVRMALRVLNHSSPNQALRLTARLYIKK